MRHPVIYEVIMDLMIDKVVAGFKVLRREEVPEVSGTVYEMEHVKSGARLLYIDTADTNKVFSIGFRTPPKDSTGVAHIMEHSVLCGSRKFPLKEPFVELVKGSLNTFLNAMTYPDKTVYPVASKNDKDFHNLMDVYLDAVFYPEVAKNKLIVMQEGWHYELEKPEDPLTYKGVVYNEMKGVYSSPDSLLDRHMMELLFPDTTYGYESGGDPDEIPNLTYEAFQKFYQTYYHPSNAYIYLYGKMDIEEQLNFINEEYLSHFDRIHVDSEIALQKALRNEQVGTYAYGVGSDENIDHKAMHTLAFVLPEMTVEQNLAFDIITHALLTSAAAPLKQALIRAGLGSDVGGGYTDGIRQPMWNVTVTGSDTDKQAEVKELVLSTLQKLVGQGFDKELVEGSLNNTEFVLREADFGGHPIGLAYGLRAMDSWIYDRDPIEQLRYEQALTNIREGLKGSYFEDLVRTYILQNPHQALVTIYPKQGLQAEKEAALRDKLAKIKASMSPEEIQQVIADTKALKARQEAPDSPEALATIPLLELSDLNPEAESIERTEEKLGTATIHKMPTAAKGIVYSSFYFPISGLSEDEFYLAELLTDILGRMNTDNASYEDLAKDVNLHLGDFSVDMTAISKHNEREAYVPLFVVRTKALRRSLGHIGRIVVNILQKTDFSDTTRLSELINETKAIWSTEAFRRGHTLVSNQIQAQVSEIGKFRYNDNLGYFSWLAELQGQEDKILALPKKLEKVLKKIISRPMDISFVGDVSDYADFIAMVQPLVADLKGDSPVKADANQPIVFSDTFKNTGITTAGKVQYVAQGGNFKDFGYKRSGAMSVLEVILRYEYLWIRVRVQGGAYGAFANFYNNGNMVFCSYRDPNLTETLDVYKGLPDYLRQFTLTDREMRKYIIGTMSGLDLPMTPNLRGPRGMAEYFSGSTTADKTAFRKSVIACTVEDIQRLADVVEAVIASNHVCVMGNEEKIKAAGNVLTCIESLPQ